MPVDLSPAGRPSPFPRRPRFWPWWFCVWLACIVFGVAIALLLWPKGQPARGAWFWFSFVGLPNGAFLFLFAIERAGYEAFWFRAHFRNLHRNRWLAERLRVARKPLRVLGIGSCLPLGDQSLSSAIAAKTRLPAPQVPRSGSYLVEHARFEDADWKVDDPVIPDLLAGSEGESATKVTAKQVSLLALKIAQALKPLSESLQALTRYEPAWWPQVRVLAEPGAEAAREQDVCDALRIASLPPLVVQSEPAASGLLVADAWLDAREGRPLLVIATAWREGAPLPDSTEGCIAVLLDAGFYRLPADVPVLAMLHRPVEGKPDEVEYGFANAALWGGVNVASVTGAWITRPVERCDRALRIANLDAIAKSEAQRLPARIVGDMGNANGWLSVAAAIDSGAADGPQLVIDGVQSAILRVLPVTPGNDSPLEEPLEPFEYGRSETEPATV